MIGLFSFHRHFWTWFYFSLLFLLFALNIRAIEQSICTSSTLQVCRHLIIVSPASVLNFGVKLGVGGFQLVIILVANIYFIKLGNAWSVLTHKQHLAGPKCKCVILSWVDPHSWVSKHFFLQRNVYKLAALVLQAPFFSSITRLMHMDLHHYTRTSTNSLLKNTLKETKTCSIS